MYVRKTDQQLSILGKEQIEGEGESVAITCTSLEQCICSARKR